MSKKLLDNIFHSSGHLSQEELDAYLANEASPSLRRKVESSMLDNPLLSEAIEGYEEMKMSTLPSFEKFSDFKKKLPPEPEAKVRSLSSAKLLLRLAAVGVVLLLAIAGYFALQEPTEQNLFTDYYEVYENDISLSRRGEADGLNKNFKNALSHYTIQEYKAALPLFRNAVKADPANDAHRFFAGLTCLELDETQEAREYLISVKNNGGIYALKAHWYAILATVKAGDKATAKSMLDDFIVQSDYRKEDAEALRKQLRVGE